MVAVAAAPRPPLAFQAAQVAVVHMPHLLARVDHRRQPSGLDLLGGLVLVPATAEAAVAALVKLAIQMGKGLAGTAVNLRSQEQPITTPVVAQACPTERSLPVVKAAEGTAPEAMALPARMALVAAVEAVARLHQGQALPPAVRAAQV